MSSGEPDWARLHAMGKLPKSQRHQIPQLAALDKAEQQIADLKSEVKCQIEGCDYIAKGSAAQQKQRMTLHAKSHQSK